jgi:hypothetical protein
MTGAADVGDLLDHPVVSRALDAHGLDVDHARTLRARDAMRRLILTADEGRPAITATMASVTVNWENASITMTRLRSGGMHIAAMVHGLLPDVALTAARGRTLDQIVDLPGVETLVIVDAWNNDDGKMVTLVAE